ncbi:MAG: hypothetical protein Q7S42_04705 [Candidatus Omnitrophota bacterium]|nr:hypothetical protein [Candidatus Omnitrophota bacterium]
MKLRKVLIILPAVFLVFGYAGAFAGVSKGERVTYAISPLGKAEYNDMGLVDYRGKKLWLVTFLTRVIGFCDLEKIYVDSQTGLPLTVERYIKWPLSKEFLIEEYDSQNNSQVTRRFVKNKLTNEYKYKSNGPYYNAILLPFYLRGVKDLNIGWSMVVRVPDEFVVRLQNIENIKVNGKIIAAYHFTSKPDKFEIWLSKDKDLLPVVIKGTAGYKMFMKSHSVQEQVK